VIESDKYPAPDLPNELFKADDIRKLLDDMHATDLPTHYVDDVAFELTIKHILNQLS